jgi:hypothetical protein
VISRYGATLCEAAYCMVEVCSQIRRDEVEDFQRFMTYVVHCLQHSHRVSYTVPRYCFMRLPSLSPSALLSRQVAGAKVTPCSRVWLLECIECVALCFNMAIAQCEARSLSTSLWLDLPFGEVCIPVIARLSNAQVGDFITAQP